MYMCTEVEITAGHWTFSDHFLEMSDKISAYTYKCTYKCTYTYDSIQVSDQYYYLSVSRIFFHLCVYIMQ